MDELQLSYQISLSFISLMPQILWERILFDVLVGIRDHCNSDFKIRGCLVKLTGSKITSTLCFSQICEQSPKKQKSSCLWKGYYHTIKLKLFLSSGSYIVKVIERYYWSHYRKRWQREGLWNLQKSFHIVSHVCKLIIKCKQYYIGLWLPTLIIWICSRLFG